MGYVSCLQESKNWTEFIVENCLTEQLSYLRVFVDFNCIRMFLEEIAATIVNRKWLIDSLKGSNWNIWKL